MKYQIIGDTGKTIETRTGKHMREIVVVPTRIPVGYLGLPAQPIQMWDDVLEVLSVETVNGKIFDPKDGKDYFIDIDRDARGRIIDARIYNG